jgi:RHS repeat-associated protein
MDERLWAVQDANWNVVALVDGSQAVDERYAYDPFGSTTVYDGSFTVRSGGTNYAWVYNFQGMQHDAVSGLDAANERWFSPSLRTWTSLDPIMFQGGDNRLYGFVLNNPTNDFDPSGQVGASISVTTHILLAPILPMPIKPPPPKLLLNVPPPLGLDPSTVAPPPRELYRITVTGDRFTTVYTYVLINGGWQLRDSILQPPNWYQLLWKPPKWSQAPGFTGEPGPAYPMPVPTPDPFPHLPTIPQLYLPPGGGPPKKK